MGAIYEAIHVETEGHHALKIMHAHLFKSEDLRERFRREARVTSKIKSDFIIQISDAGVDQATQMPFIVMELLDGEDLSNVLARAGRLHPHLALTCLRQIASALDKTHAANIVHRDLKPDNLFLTWRDDKTPQIKILDFGIAKIVEASAARKGTQAMGTPIFMAPEQVNPAVPLTGAADIYALGMLAFAFLVGIPYWNKELDASVGLTHFINMVCQGPKNSAVQRAAEYGVSLPPAFDAWFATITALHPNQRFSRASAAISALEQVLFGWASLPPADRPSQSGAGDELGQSPQRLSAAQSAQGSGRLPVPPSGGAGGSMDAMVTVLLKKLPRNQTIWLFAAGVWIAVLLALALWFGFRTPSGESSAAPPNKSSTPPVLSTELESSASTPAAPASSSAQKTMISDADPVPPDAGLAKPSVRPPVPKKKPRLYAPN